MDIKYLKQEKNEIEAEFPNLTFVELLRVYLNEEKNVLFAAWRRDHPTMNPILKIKTKDKDAKSILKDTIQKVISDLDKISQDFKGLK